jgi:hypothetical protein
VEHALYTVWVDRVQGVLRDGPGAA